MDKFCASKLLPNALVSKIFEYPSYSIAIYLNKCDIIAAHLHTLGQPIIALCKLVNAFCANIK